MEMWYPITGTHILSHEIFHAYGGDDLGVTGAQVTAALCIAEQLAQLELNTFIEPQSWTGSFDRLAYGQPLMLPHSHLRSIDSVVLRCEVDTTICSVRRITSCAHIKDRNASIVELRLGRDICGAARGCCSCTHCGRPLNFEIAYTAGIPPGQLASAPIALAALTALAQEALEQLADPGASEGGAGAPGVMEWRQFWYGEKRFGLKVTQLGNSARANYAQKLLQPWKVKRAYKISYRG